MSTHLSLSHTHTNSSSNSNSNTNSNGQARPFTISIPEEDIQDLQDRLRKTKSPPPFDEGTRGRGSYGVPYDLMQSYLDYFTQSYSWRSQERWLNENFHHFKMIVTPESMSHNAQLADFILHGKNYAGLKQEERNLEVPGLDLHFIHETSTLQDGSIDTNAIPLCLLHGWPGSFVEFHKLIPKLVQSGNGATQDKAKAFHVVAPSLPGYGFSQGFSKPGMSARCAAHYIHQLMLNLGYSQYAVQGGDWGAVVAKHIATDFPKSCVALHLNMPLAAPYASLHPRALLLFVLSALHLSPLKRLFLGSEDVKRLNEFSSYMSYGSAYFLLQSTRPQTLAWSTSDSPAGLLAWILEKFFMWTDCHGDLDSTLSKDEVLTNIMLYWLCNASASSYRFYYETVALMPGVSNHLDMGYVGTPTAIASFPKEIINAPKIWSKLCYNLKQFTYMEKGGHFAAIEQPDLLANDIKKFLYASTSWDECVKFAQHRKERNIDIEFQARANKGKEGMLSNRTMFLVVGLSAAALLGTIMKARL